MMEPLFDYQKLDVYRVELAFIAWIADFLGDVAQSSVQYRRELIEQLDRASLSVLLNTAEGNGKRQGRQRAKFSMTPVARHSSAPPASMRRSLSAWSQSIVFNPVRKCSRVS
jgi:hypothetical protein